MTSRFDIDRLLEDILVKTYEVGLAEVEFPEGVSAAPYVKAYRQWLGTSPHSQRIQTS